MSVTRRRVTSMAVALALTAVALTASATAAEANERPGIVPLPDHLEQIRAAEAQELYGNPDVRPIADRDTALTTIGDSQISGEGVGNYDPDTHRDGNWCDRSYDQAVFRTGIPSDRQYNLACSGAASPHLIEGSGQQQWDELNQGDQLAIKARNTHVKLVWMIIGANDSGGIEFGPTATECATNRVLYQGECWPNHTDDWSARVDVSADGVAKAIDSVRGTMSDAGYLDSDYELVVMSYPSPVTPDAQDNPDFPGWYAGGCMFYLEDAAFARNKAVPLFEAGIQRAVLSRDARYIDAGRLFDGHGVCEDNTWARGLYVEVGELPSEHAFRQSFHPNARGHGAFAECVTRFWDTGFDRGTCVDPASTGSPSLYEGLFEFQDLENIDSGLCVDAEGYDSRVDTALRSYGCHGGRNQGFYHDKELGSLHVELSHDRCADAGDDAVTLRDCDGAASQKFTVDDAGVHPDGEPGRCIGFDGPGEQVPLVVTECGTADSRMALSARDYDAPRGYGHDDWIGSSTY